MREGWLVGWLLGFFIVSDYFEKIAIKNAKNRDVEEAKLEGVGEGRISTHARG